MKNILVPILTLVYISILYIKRTHGFGLTFPLSIIPLNKFDYKNVVLFVLFKKIRIYIIFVTISMKKISIVCYNMKV